jgi:hypothetical protein
MLFFGTHAQVIPDAWTRWVIGSREYQRFEGGRVGWRIPGTSGRSARDYHYDVRPVDLELRPKARKAVA